MTNAIRKHIKLYRYDHLDAYCTFIQKQSNVSTVDAFIGYLTRVQSQMATKMMKMQRREGEARGHIATASHTTTEKDTKQYISEKKKKAQRPATLWFPTVGKSPPPHKNRFALHSLYVKSSLTNGSRMMSTLMVRRWRCKARGRAP